MIDAAAVIRSLDLVVSCDTAMLHLAGALAAPVWGAIPFAPDWRWLLDREDSPWYPSARLFRQASPGDWAGVAERVAQALRAMSSPLR
jgi:ADP-heptose:LPS heptosyltransferase